MNIFDSKHKNLIQTTFPTEKFLKMCGKMGIDTTTVSETDTWNNDLIKKIFLKSIEQFLEGNINTDELSDIGNNLYNSFLKKNRADGNLNNALGAAAELSYYVRLKDTSKFDAFKITVLDFFEKES